MSLAALAWAYFRRRALLTLSALGIALGVAVLFAMLAVVNGFLAEFERTLRSFTGDVVVRPARGSESSLAEYERAAASAPSAALAAPRVNWFGLVGRRGSRALDDPRSADLSGLLLVGVEPGREALPGAEALAAASPFPPLVLGDEAAWRLGARPGDALEVISFRGGEGGAWPFRATFRVAGTFHTGQYDQDLDRALVRREDLARVLHLDPPFTELVVRGRPGADVDGLALEVRDALRAAALPAEVATWRAQAGKLLAAVKNQRAILAVVFFFIVLVAAYQLVATLTLTVAEKRHDVGVLAALGTAPGRIAGFFVTLGLTIACTGTAIGLLLGTWLSRHLEWIENWVGGGRPIFVAEVYKFERIPVAVEPASVGVLVAATLAAALLFSFLPAWRAARLPAVKALLEK